MRASADRSGEDARTFLPVSLGTNIRWLRPVAGLRTRRELAERLGVSQSQVADWEHDRYALISVRSLIKLATVFHCSVDERLPGEQEGEQG